MGIILTILLVIIVIIFLERPKKSGPTQIYTVHRQQEDNKPLDRSINETKKEDKQPASNTPSQSAVKITYTSTSSSGARHQSVKRTSGSSNSFSSITINGMNVSGEEADRIVTQFFGEAFAPAVESTSDFDLEKEFEESGKVTQNEHQKKRKEEEKKKRQQEKKLRKELDDIVKFIWPDVSYEDPWNLAWEGAFSGIMYNFQPSKLLYGMYEHLLSEYPNKLSLQQKTWINFAVRMLFEGAPAYIYYDNDDSIIEEYKYLSYPSQIRQILFENPNKYPKLIAAMAAWSVYECDIQCLEDMLSQYETLDNAGQKEYIHQLLDSFSHTRAEVFEHTLTEIKSVMDTMGSFVEDIPLEDPYDEKNRDSTLLYLKQGYEVKNIITSIKKGVVWKKKEKMKKINPVRVFFQYPNGKQGDIDMYIAATFGNETGLVEDLLYYVEFPGKHLQYVDMMLYNLYYHNRSFRFDGYNERNKEAYDIPPLYNNYDLLREQLFSVSEEDKYYLSKPYNEAVSFYREYLNDEIVQERKIIYEELVANGEASGKWKSEQQVYSLVRQRFPDAKYQFHAEWLGLQSKPSSFMRRRK